MEKRLSIVIPRYKETEEILTGLLCSIRFQSNVKFEEIEILIVNDNPDSKLSIEWVKDISEILGLDIRVLDMEKNGGPGLARQYGLDNATGKYVMFCDADDTLYSTEGLSKLLGELLKFPETEYLSSQWHEEHYDESHQNVFYLFHDIENTWLHGKIFDRQFIIDHDIKFHPSLRVHEDSYFLLCLGSISEHRRHLTSPTYIWRATRKDSITRDNDSSYTYYSFPEFIRSICLGIKWLKETDNRLIDYTVIQLIIYCFFTLQKREWLKPEHKADREASIAMLKQEIAPYISYYEKAPKDFVDRIYNEERNKIFKGEVEAYSFTEWVGRIA